MANFANPMAGRETANPLGAEEATFDLQRFAGGNPFGITPAEGLPGDSGGEPSEPADTPETPETPAEPAATPEKAPEAAAPAPTQGEPAKPTTGEPDPLAKFRKPDGTLDIERMSKSYLDLEKGYGDLRNDVHGLRQQLAQFQQAKLAPETGEPAQPEVDWEAVNAQFTAEFAENPVGAMLTLLQQFAQHFDANAIAPLRTTIEQRDFLQHVSDEATSWWANHKDVPDDLKAAMQQEFGKYQPLLTTPHPQDLNRPFMTPSEILDLCYAVARGQAAPKAIEQAAEVAARAATAAQVEKAGAGMGAAGKAPATPSNLTGMEELNEVARSMSNPFGIRGG